MCYGIRGDQSVDKFRCWVICAAFGIAAVGAGGCILGRSNWERGGGDDVERLRPGPLWSFFNLEKVWATFLVGVCVVI